MNKKSMMKLEKATDDQLILDFFRNINRDGIVLISTAFRDERESNRRPWADAFFLQWAGEYPPYLFVSHDALRRWYPTRNLLVRMISLLDKEFRGGGGDFEYVDDPEFSSDPHEIPCISEKADFFGLCAEDVERKWSELAGAYWGCENRRGWSAHSAYVILELKNQITRLEKVGWKRHSDEPSEISIRVLRFKKAADSVNLERAP